MIFIINNVFILIWFEKKNLDAGGSRSPCVFSNTAGHALYNSRGRIRITKTYKLKFKKLYYNNMIIQELYLFKRINVFVCCSQSNTGDMSILYIPSLYN